MKFLERQQLRLRDSLRFGRPWQAGAAVALTEFGRRRGSATDVALHLSRLCRAARITPFTAYQRRIERKAAALANRIRFEELDWDALYPRSASKSIPKSILLKRRVSDREKGLLLVSFEEQWVRILRHGDLQRLAADYDIVLAPSWSPPHDLAMLLFAAAWPSRFFTLLSNFDDAGAMERIAPNVQAVRLLASSWVHPDLFMPQPDLVKTYDIVMLANFAVYKRHFRLFQVMAAMERKPRVLLLGRPMEHRDENTIRREAELFGVGDFVTIKVGLPDHELVKEMQRAKVSLILTKTEGSCVAVTEALFLNLPVGLLENARIGSKAFINSSTGALLRERCLADDLRSFIDASQTFAPRTWAVDKGIDCHASTHTLDQAVKQRCLADGGVWTEGIVAHHWRPNPEYVRSEDRVRLLQYGSRFLTDYGFDLAGPSS